MAASGVWVAFLGPDGSGKSAVISEVERLLAPHFSSLKRFHLRPHWGRPQVHDVPVTDPHAQSERHPLLSLAKLGVWWGDYTLGYVARVRPLVAHGALVLFDRYYHDVLVDPRRYRHGGSLRIPARLARWIPSPDVILVLDAPAAMLRERKAEVSAAEIARQRDAYRRLALDHPRARLVDASRPLGEVAAEVASIIRGLRQVR